MKRTLPHYTNTTANVAIIIIIITISFVLETESLSTSSIPEFYSELSSPLAKTALRHAIKGNPVPQRLFDDDVDDEMKVESKSDNFTVATFAGGCFWGLELAYRREPGVISTCVGYTQGDDAPYPTYTQVCAEETGHTEAVLLTYDPNRVDYAKLVNILFRRIPDPTMLNRVGRDRGTQYRTGMYAHSEQQYAEATAEFDRENRSWAISGRPVVTEVRMAGAFWPAEEQHQRYLEKGGRFGRPQSAEKGNIDEIRCYG